MCILRCSVISHVFCNNVFQWLLFHYLYVLSPNLNTIMAARFNEDHRSSQLIRSSRVEPTLLIKCALSVNISFDKVKMRFMSAQSQHFHDDVNNVSRHQLIVRSCYMSRIYKALIGLCSYPVSGILVSSTTITAVPQHPHQYNTCA